MTNINQQEDIALKETVRDIYQNQISSEAKKLARLYDISFFKSRIYFIIFGISLIALYTSLPFLVEGGGLTLMKHFVREGGFFLFFGLAGAFNYRNYSQKKDVLFDCVVKNMSRKIEGLLYKKSPQNNVDLAPFVYCGLVGGFSRKQVFDQLSGRYQGTDFKLYTVLLMAVSRQRAVKVFSGKLMELSLPKTLETNLLMERCQFSFFDKIRRSFHKDMGRVPVLVKDNNFNKKYRLYSTNPDEISHEMKERLIKLVERTEKQPLSLFIEGNKVLVHFYSNGFFDTYQKTNPISVVLPMKKVLQKDAQLMIKQLTLPHRIIRHLTA